MLTVSRLACVRGDQTLFSGLDFSLAAGDCLHVGGENGAGKTSLLRMLCGLSLPAEGEIRWHGQQIAQLAENYRRELLYLGHHNALKEDLSALENLRLNAALAGCKINEETAMDHLGQAGLPIHKVDLPVRALSQGQKRRTALARLLSSRARLWILDEPFVALDVAAVDWLAKRIGRHLASSGLVVLTSHQEVDIAGGRLQTLRLNG